MKKGREIITLPDEHEQKTNKDFYLSVSHDYRLGSAKSITNHL